MIFAPQAGHRIFGIEPGCNFAHEIVHGLLERCAGLPPEALARVTIYANTSRAARMLNEAFAGHGTKLLPRILPLTELANEPLPGMTSGPSPTGLQQLLHLMPTVLALLESDPDLAPRASLYDLTQSLLTLGKEFEIEGLDLAALEAIDPGTQDLQAHWSTSLSFLTLLTDVLKGDGTGPDARMKAATDMLAARWQKHPPADPVLVVGSTGSRGTTRAFMDVVATLPQGAIVLPGFEFDVPRSVQSALMQDPDHPQHGFEVLAHALGYAWSDVQRWSTRPTANPARNRLVSVALRPAPVTDQWLSEGPKLIPDLEAAQESFDLIEAKDERQEALAIALRLREARALGQSAALITPNRNLARRVTAELGRWNIIPDDSGGQPLHLTPPGIFLRLVVEMLGKPMHPAPLLRLLKHPLCAKSDRQNHLSMVRFVQTRFFAGGPSVVTSELLGAWWAGLVDKPQEGEPWIEWLMNILDMAALPFGGPLAEMAVQHRSVAETFAGGVPAQSEPLWEKNAGETARALMEELTQSAAHVGLITDMDYATILRGALSSAEARPEAFADTKGIAIWGTLEARIQWADVIVLGGLNEGIWPRLPTPDPWLSRSLRAHVGLPPMERTIGLSAHDFQQACGAARVVLTRAGRTGGEPAVPSRWITRLTSLLSGLGEEGQATLDAMRARGAATLALARAFEAPLEAMEPAKRPSPRPPVENRPQKLSVTQVETLIRDPYAIYCAHVLKLRRLDPPGREPDFIERGNVLHAVMERFWEAYLESGQTFNAQDFLNTAAAVFAKAVPWPVARQRWFARLERIAERFVADEMERRALAAPRLKETKGLREIKGLSQPFALSARVDRIDQMPSGALAIYDYKAGSVAGEKEIRAFAKQLPLQAAIAEAGGFEGLDPAPVAQLALIGFTSSSRHITTLKGEDVAAAQHWDELAALIARYFDAETGYTARLRPQQLGTYSSDYDHLSRYGEWSDTSAPKAEDVP